MHEFPEWNYATRSLLAKKPIDRENRAGFRLEHFERALRDWHVFASDVDQLALVAAYSSFGEFFRRITPPQSLPGLLATARMADRARSMAEGPIGGNGKLYDE